MVAALTGQKPFDPARRATLFDPIESKNLKPSEKEKAAEKAKKPVKGKEQKTAEHQTSFLAEFLETAEAEVQWQR